ncbi:MAG: PIN domain-containing protein [Candidatus Hydrothermarchaeales archaeon]
MIDTNVFISAVKKPSGDTLKLLLRIIEDQEIEFVGNDLLIEELLRYGTLFKSETALLILSSIIGKMEIITVKENYIKACKPYFSTKSLVDIAHAATCLQTDSVLITNDNDFNEIKDRGIIQIWDIARTLRTLKE